jgi:hypothetical protein
MGNSSSSGSFLRKVLAWVIIAVVAVLAFKLVVAAVAGFLHFLFIIALIGLVIFGVLWALRNL